MYANAPAPGRLPRALLLCLVIPALQAGCGQIVLTEVKPRTERTAREESQEQAAGAASVVAAPRKKHRHKGWERNYTLYGERKAIISQKHFTQELAARGGRFRETTWIMFEFKDMTQVGDVDIRLMLGTDSSPLYGMPLIKESIYEAEDGQPAPVTDPETVCFEGMVNQDPAIYRMDGSVVGCQERGYETLRICPAPPGNRADLYLRRLLYKDLLTGLVVASVDLATQASPAGLKLGMICQSWVRTASLKIPRVLYESGMLRARVQLQLAVDSAALIPGSQYLTHLRIQAVSKEAGQQFARR